MPLYKYEVVVDLPDIEEAQTVINAIHLAICAGTNDLDEDGNVAHICGRNWSASVHGFVPINFEQPPTAEEPGAVEVEWDDESKAVAEADSKMAFEDGLV